MNKLSLFFITALISHSFYTNPIVKNDIRTPKEYKTENTFSGDLLDNNFFHLIFAKNKKQKNYKVFSYLFDGNHVEELPGFTNEKAYNIVSFHSNNNILSLLLEFKIKKKSFLKKIDYNLTTKEKTEFESTSHEGFLTSVRVKDTSILLYKLDDTFKVSTYFADEKTTDKELSLKDNPDFEKYLKDERVSSVRTDEFVANGSTSKLKLYYENNSLFFTKNTKKATSKSTENKTDMVIFNLNKRDLSPSYLSLKEDNGVKFKKSSSYFSEGKLFQLTLSKKEGFVTIFDVKSQEKLNNISLNNSLGKIIKANTDFKGIEKFLKSAGKKHHIATITANKTNTNKIAVRVDYVESSYGYQYDWWWHHRMHMQFMQNQQMMQMHRISVPSGFGPNNTDDDVLFLNIEEAEKAHHFELLIDVNGQLLNEEIPSTIYKEIYKEKYIDKLEESRFFKFHSSCFLKEDFRFIAYNKKLKTFTIQTSKL